MSRLSLFEQEDSGFHPLQNLFFLCEVVVNWGKEWSDIVIENVVNEKLRNKKYRNHIDFIELIFTEYLIFVTK